MLAGVVKEAQEVVSGRYPHLKALCAGIELLVPEG